MNSDMSDWINDASGLSIPASKILIGSGSPGPGGESVSTSAQTYTYYKGVYPTLRGAMLWATNADVSDGWQFASQIGSAI
jgi:hypothetical protein